MSEYKVPATGAVIPIGLYVTIKRGAGTRMFSGGCRIQPYHEVVKVSDEKAAKAIGIVKVGTVPPKPKTETSGGC